MKQLTHNQINEWAEQIARMIDFCEPSQFTHSFEGFEAEIKYTCDYKRYAGDYWTAPEIIPTNEKVTILGLWDIEEGDDYPEMLHQLQNLLN